MTTEIDLNIDVNDLRNLYFRNNRQRYFFGPKTKRQSLYLVFALITFPFFAIHAFKSSDEWYFILGCIFFSFLIYDYWKAARTVIKWKKSILKFLKKVKQINVLKFQYNDSFFIHIQDDQELKQEWAVIERAVVNNKFIWLFSDTNILLPKKSMNQEEFEALSKMIFSKVKNVEKE